MRLGTILGENQKPLQDLGRAADKAAEKKARLAREAERNRRRSKGHIIPYGGRDR